MASERSEVLMSLKIVVSKRELSEETGPYLKYESDILCVWHGDQGYELRPGADGVLEINPVEDEEGRRPSIVLHPRGNGVGVGRAP